MSDTFQKPAKHALNHAKLRLQTPHPSVKGKYCYCAWDVFMNNPRVIVSTNDPAFMNKERGFGRITAAMDTPTFFVFLDFIEKAIASETPVRWKIENYSTPKGAGFGSPPVLATDLFVGRDQEGCIFMSVVNRQQEGWPVIKFIFGAPDGRFEKCYKTDGGEWSRAEQSVGYAKAYTKILAAMMPLVLVNNYVEPPPYVPNGGARGGNGGGYGQQRNGGNAPAPANGGGDDDFSDLVF